MFFGSILVPFIVGLVTNKVSDLFRQENLSLIVNELYEKSVDEFNKKYRSAYGGEYDNFLARDKNLEHVMKTVLSFKQISDIEFENTSDFLGNPTPDEVVKDFISIFHGNLNNDERLVQYRQMREHHFLTETILNEIKQLKQIRFKKFVIPDEYFNDVAGTETKKLERDLERVIEAINISDIVLIDSYRGFGKTETLKYISKSESMVKLFNSIIVMRHGVRNIVDSIQTELFQGEKYLIIVDDCDLCMDEIKELLNFIKSIGGVSKVIMSVQTYSVEMVKSLILNAGLINKMVQISLNSWEKADYIELLRKASQESKYEDEDIIVAKYPSPTLLKWIGEKTVSSNQHDIEFLFREYRELLENDAYEIVNNYMSREDCNRLLFSLCCIVPFDLSDDQCRDINESFQRNYDIKAIVRLMQKGGIIRKVGYKYRFFPDIKGDIFLASTLNGEYDVHILDYWIKRDQNSVLQNISEAGLVNKIDIQDKLKLLIDEWSRSEEYFEQSENLEIASYIVRFSQESVINLIYSYLESTKSSDDGRYSRLTTDNFGPVVVKLWQYNVNIEAILNFLCELETYQMDGLYDNYKVKGLTSELFSPVKNNSRKINKSLTILKKWIENGRYEALTIFKYAASEIQKGSHEITKPIINGIQYGQAVVSLTDEVVSMREKCLEIIGYLINNSFEYRTIKVIETIFYEIGNMAFGNGDLEESSLKHLIEEERKKLVELLGEKLLISDDISANIIIERILIYCWASQTPGYNYAESYLLKFKPDGKFLFAKYYVDVDYRVISFDEIAKIAPSEERWKWFVETIMHNTNDVRNDSTRIAEMLHNEIESVSQLKEFFIYESRIIDNFGLAWSIPNIIGKWFELDNNLFVEFFQSEHYSDIAGYFKASILEAVVSDNNKLEQISRSMLVPEVKLSNEEIYTLLRVAADPDIDDTKVLTIINRIIDNYDFEHSGNIIRKLYFIFKERDRSCLTSILLKVIQKYPFNKSMIDMLSFIIKQFINDLEGDSKFQELKDEVLKKLNSLPELSFHEEQLIEMLLNSIEEAVYFIEDRLKNLEDRVKLVPYGGFSFLNKFVLDSDDFKFLIYKLMEFEDNKLVSHYNLMSIIKPLFAKNDEEGICIGTRTLKYFIDEKDTRGVIILLKFFVLSKKNVVDFVDAVKYLNEIGKQKEAESMIYLHRFPDGAWSRSLGQNAPELMNRISLYSEIHKLIPFGRLKLVVEKCIDSMREDMDNDLLRDEEILNPR